MRFKKAILLLLVVLLSCGLLLGCDSEKEVQSEKDKVPQELVIGIGRDFYEGPETANFLHGSTGVWEGLTYPGDDLEPVMQLATKLTPDDTNKVWMVTLRDGVKFHDDSPLNADAVVKSVMRLKNTPKLDGYGTSQCKASDSLIQIILIKGVPLLFRQITGDSFVLHPNETY